MAKALTIVSAARVLIRAVRHGKICRGRHGEQECSKEGDEAREGWSDSAFHVCECVELGWSWSSVFVVMEKGWRW